MVASLSAMISASAVERAMLFCFREPHVSAACCQSEIQPEVEWRVSHEASAKLTSFDAMSPE